MIHRLVVWLFFFLPGMFAHAAGNLMFMPRPQAPASVPVYCPSGSAFPLVRVLSSSYWSNWNGPSFSSMTPWVDDIYKWEAPTNDVKNGELIIALAFTDNGSSTTWTSSGGFNKLGFTQLAQKNWGSDGQTYVAAYKVAYNEPVRYAGQLNNTISGSKVIVLLAVDCYNATTPIQTAKSQYLQATGTSTTTATKSLAAVSGLTVNSLLLYFTGGDWTASGTSTINSYATPSGFTDLGLFGDRGPGSLPLVVDWTSLSIAYMVNSTTSAGPFSGNQVCASGSDGLGAAGLITVLAP